MESLLKAAADAGGAIVAIIVFYLVIRSILKYFEQMMGTLTLIWEKALKNTTDMLAANTQAIDRNSDVAKEQTDAIRKLFEIVSSDRTYSDERTRRAVEELVREIRSVH